MDDRILTALLGGMLTRFEIEQQTGASARSSIERLRRQGLLVGVPGQGYRLTPLGMSTATHAVTQSRLLRLESQVDQILEKLKGILPAMVRPGVTEEEVFAQLMDLDPRDRDLYDRLRRGRNMMAEILRISNYQLGQNRALRMIADMQSSSPDPVPDEAIVGVVPGMTPKTWARIGSVFRSVLDTWCAERHSLEIPV